MKPLRTTHRCSVRWRRFVSRSPRARLPTARSRSVQVLSRCKYSVIPCLWAGGQSWSGDGSGAAGEDAPVAGVQRVEVDVFDRLGVLVVAVHLAAAFGVAGPDPVGGAVAGAVEPVGVDEGLQQDGGVAVAVLPVGGQLPGGAGEDR